MATNFDLFSRDNPTTSAVYNTLAKEIQCYSLPYGGLGFISHVLTYYTIVCLWNGRKPMMPWRPVKYSWFDLALGVVGLCVSTAMSIVTIVKCRNTWQLLVIAVWKLSVSFLNGITAIHVALFFLKASRKERLEGAKVEVPMDDLGAERGEQAAPLRPEKLGQKPLKSPPSSLWVLLYIPGMIAGMSGLMNLVKHNKGHKGVVTITCVFYLIVGIGLLFFVGGTCGALCPGGGKDSLEAAGLCLGIAFVVFSALSVFYSDWVLGMMTTNLVGLPSGESSVFYWTYFISKRLPMFSW